MRTEYIDSLKKRHMAGGNRKGICSQCAAIVTTKPVLVFSDGTDIIGEAFAEPIRDLMAFECVTCGTVVGFPHDASYQIKHAIDQPKMVDVSITTENKDK